MAKIPEREQYLLLDGVHFECAQMEQASLRCWAKDVDSMARSSKTTNARAYN